jgi:hypothetical protein
MADKGIKHLDYAIGALALLIAVFVVLMPFRDLAHDTWDFSGISGYFPRFKMDGVMGFLVFFCIPAYFIYRHIQKRKEGAPMGIFGSIFGEHFGNKGPEFIEKGPMKLDIRSEEIKAPNYRHVSEGGRNWHRMYIDFKITRQDYDKYKRSGLMENELFGMRHPKYPDVMMSFAGGSLGYIRFVDFPNVQEMESARDDLIQGLHAVRSRIENPPGKLSIEI